MFCFRRIITQCPLDLGQAYSRALRPWIAWSNTPVLLAPKPKAAKTGVHNVFKWCSMHRILLPALLSLEQNSSQTLSQTCAFKRGGVSLNWDSPSHGIPCSFGSPKFWDSLIVVLATRKQQSSWCAPPLLRFLGEYDEWTDNGTNLWVSKWVRSSSWGFLWLPVLLCILI